MPNAPWRPRHLSVSAVELYARCPAAYKRRYVDGIKDPPSGPMAFGRVMAQALEALHRGQDGELVFLREYIAQVQVPRLTGAASLGHGLALLRVYQGRNGGVGVGEPEKEFRVYLPDRDAVPVVIWGFMDLATEREVWEYKSSQATWDQGRVDNSHQASVYRYAFWQVYGRKPDAVRFLILHTRRVELTELLAYPAGPELRLFELQAAACWRGIREQHYPPRCGQCPACRAVAPVGPAYPSLEVS